MAAVNGAIRFSKVSPNFLHANSTSHTWPFSAIAELIDNAYDPDVNASELWIDKVDINGTGCLTFIDNGNGLDEEKLLKMLSFGFCEKDIFEKSNHKPIGHYGNGFKSGSMRLGQDAIVFTRHFKTTSVGLLSQTYLKVGGCETVMVPIVTWDLPNYKKRHSEEDTAKNLSEITQYSPFTSEDDIIRELKGLERLRTGTKIIIYNLKRSKMGSYELDFESDGADIRNPETLAMDMTTVYRPMQEATPEFRQSLREYCSILFLKPRMKIVIRGEKVKTKLISKSLSHTEIDLYKPGWLGRPLKIVFGFTCSKNASSDNYGLMMYHRNRLIKAYEKVGFQRQRNNLGEGVVGVVQVDFLQPIHNKQDFNKDEKYNAFMTSISQKLNDYWNEKKCGVSRVQVAPAGNLPDWLWAQCENCLKWRRLPDGIRQTALPDRWFCHMNPDASHNRCEIEMEPEDEDEALARPTYTKTYKKQLEEKKRMMKIEEEKRRALKERELQERERSLQRAMHNIRNGNVSSTLQTNMRKDVSSLQQELIESKKREAHQKRLILQLQEQKKNAENKKSTLLKAAENLRVVNMENNNLLETAESLAGVSPVSSTSGNMKIKMETGEVIAIVENNEDDGECAPGKRKHDSSDVIDLTLDEEDIVSPTPAKQSRIEEDVKPDKDVLDEEMGVDLNIQDGGKSSENRPSSDSEKENSKDSSNKSGKVSNKKSRKESTESVQGDSPVHKEKNSNVNAEIDTNEKDSNQNSGRDPSQNSGKESNKKKSGKDSNPNSQNEDKKPNVSELDKQISETSKEKNEERKKKNTTNKQKQIAPRKELTDSDNSQRYEKLKEMYAAKCTELSESEDLLKKLQTNVHKLLQIIVPDVELGDITDIQFIVDEMIRVNSDESLMNSGTTSSSTESPTAESSSKSPSATEPSTTLAAESSTTNSSSASLTAKT